MKIKEALLEEHSKNQTLMITNYIGSDTKKFKQLMQLFFCDDVLLNQRSAWVMWYCFEKTPSLITPFINKLVNNLKNNVHDAVKRNTLKVLIEIDIPKKLQGILCDICFDLLQTHETSIALKVYAMTVLKNICFLEPDLKNELKLVIEHQLPNSSAGYKSRAKRVLKEIDKL